MNLSNQLFNPLIFFIPKTLWGDEFHSWNMIHVKKAFPYACFKPYLNYLQLQVRKSLTKLPPGHFSNEQRVSSTLSPWMWDEHRGWMLDPTSFLLSSATLTSAAAVPKGEKGTVLHKQELHTGVSTSFGYRDFLRVVQWFRAAVNVCVNVVPHRPVSPLRWSPAPGQQPVQGSLQGSWRRELSGLYKRVEGRAAGRACTAGSLRTLNPLQWLQTPFSIKRQGGREG